MGSVVTRCGGCGVRVRLAQPELALGRGCPRCGYSLEASLSADGLSAANGGSESQQRTDLAQSQSSGRRRRPMTVLAMLALVLILGLQLRTPRTPRGSSWLTWRSEPVGMPAMDPGQAADPRTLSEPGGGVSRSAAASAEPESPGDRADPARPSQLESSAVESESEAEIAGDAGSGKPTLPDVVKPARSDLLPPLVGTAGPGATATPRIRVQTETGRVVAARVHGRFGDQVSVLLPDGQLGFPRKLVYTDEPFRPDSADELTQELLAGPFSGFRTLRSAQYPHYLAVYQSTKPFAEASLKLLEDLYDGLTRALSQRDIPVHEPEFPLIAVIFRTEREFRAHKKVDPDVQAYYEIFTNRIYFYQLSERDEQAPEIAALRKPQTVAHEGTHQILQNVGVHPRLSSWPIWLVEGLAEYCSSPAVATKKGGVGWKGLGVVNPLHMATIRDLEDPQALQLMGNNRPRIGRDPHKPLVEYLVTRTELTPTDYALAWALTHYLALKRGPDFVAFVKTMSQLPPLKQMTPQEHLAAFRAAFGNDLAQMDHTIGRYLARLKNYDPLPYYAVMFEQRVGAGMVKRAAFVSQSTSMIRQWLETVSVAEGAPPSWTAVRHLTRSSAVLSAEQWVRGQ
jgi:hypothetical protein